MTGIYSTIESQSYNLLYVSNIHRLILSICLIEWILSDCETIYLLTCFFVCKYDLYFSLHYGLTMSVSTWKLVQRVSQRRPHMKTSFVFALHVNKMNQDILP